ncbi:unnamed protein product [Acanthoscelides obtectus]|uniref:Uncharacterized protein n=1 Tax=Acanthoscelides obtectus TaxID=200917 RepID=A0A9P0M028_ACAOB|nr:unnamed protein product [Acanthoscelides obtectus]CAK1646259.1 hypothetical protein AOBTE_LOCUS14536 [Acanthoscelides obtectus]
MRHRILLQSFFLLLVTAYLALALDRPSVFTQENDKDIPKHVTGAPRVKRATRRPGFFKTLFSVMFEQWNDTKNTIQSVNKQVNDNFLPEDYVPTPPPKDSNTTEPFRITRKEFNKIIQRNLRGIRRLYDLELKEALKQSEVYNKDFRKNASREISKFL